MVKKKAEGIAARSYLKSEFYGFPLYLRIFLCVSKEPLYKKQPSTSHLHPDREVLFSHDFSDPAGRVLSVINSQILT